MIDILLTLVLVVLLAWASYIDWQSYRLPDKITLPLIGLGLIAAWITQSNLVLHGLGALIGYLVFVGIEKAYRYARKKDGLGRGDAKLLAAGGAWCGLLALPMIVLIASFAGLAFILTSRVFSQPSSQDQPIAFGPFLSMGIAAMWIAKIV